MARNDPDFRKTFAAFGIDIDSIEDCELVRMLALNGVEYEGTDEDELDVSVVQSNSEDDDELVHLRAFVVLLKLEGSVWKKYGRLLLNLTTKCGKPCMVLRNEIGVVHFNLPVATGMAFEKVEKIGDGGHIRFMSIQDETKGLQAFTLKVGSTKMLNKLLAELENMAA